MKSNEEAQSEAPSVDVLTDKLRELLNKDNVWSHEYNGVLLEIEEAVAKINRLIAGAEENGILKGLYQARYATEPGSEEEQRIDNQIAELSNNLSKGDGDEANGA